MTEPTRTWTLTVDVEDHDDGAAFTEAMMEAHELVAQRLADDVPTFRTALTDTHGETILGGAWHGEIIESPSGWSYRSSQENGDRVDCWTCGDPLDDDYPIVNDAGGYAYHPACRSGW